MPEPAPPAARWVGYVLVAGAATSWGAQSVVAKLLLTSGIPPSSLVSTRTALAFALLTTAVAWARPGLLRVTAGDLGRLVLLGTAGMAVSQYLYYFAVARIAVSTAVLLIYTAPLFVLAASVLFLGERPRRRDLLAAVATLVGVALVARAYTPAALRPDLAGIVASLVNALAFAFYSLWGKTVPPRVSPWTMLTYSLLAAAAFWLPVAPPWGLLLDPQPALVWVGVVVVAVFGTLVPFGLYLAGLRRISAAHASLTSSLEPVVAAAVAFVVLGETVAWPQFLGGALILTGIAALHLR